MRQDVADYEFKLKISGCVFINFEFQVFFANFEFYFEFRILNLSCEYLFRILNYDFKFWILILNSEIDIYFEF